MWIAASYASLSLVSLLSGLLHAGAVREYRLPAAGQGQIILALRGTTNGWEINLRDATGKNLMPVPGTNSMTDSQMEVFTNASDKLDKGKQQTMEIRSNRKAIVQNNIGLFNELNDQLTELLYVGKILYKGVDEAKTKDYTFSELKKLVRRTVQSATANVKPAVTATEENN